MIRKCGGTGNGSWFHLVSLEEMMRLYDFKFVRVYHSNKIENERIDFHDTRDIFEKRL